MRHDTPKPRYTILVDGHGKYRVRYGDGYFPNNYLVQMVFSMHFKDKTFGNIEQAENAVKAYEEKLILDTPKIVKEIF
jgi:hypothetical protein